MKKVLRIFEVIATLFMTSMFFTFAYLTMLGREMQMMSFGTFIILITSMLLMTAWAFAKTLRALNKLFEKEDAPVIYYTRPNNDVEIDLYYKIVSTEDGQFKFQLYAFNHELMTESDPYERRLSCEYGLKVFLGKLGVHIDQIEDRS